MRKIFPYFLFFALTFPLVFFASGPFYRLFLRATSRPAKILIETEKRGGKINPSWLAFAQGGEEKGQMLAPVIEQLRHLSPRYIRLDHLYDFYEVVKKTENGYVFDFTLLDKTVDDILATGALPFFSLSYFPSAFTQSGSVIDLPLNWQDWKELVKKTIEHYSGKENRNLEGVYYEVWNEPELPQFGGWKLSGEKDYRLLYFYAAKGAEEVNNVNEFYFGGPSVGSYYSSWVKDFLTFVAQNNLRLDFYSWHRYSNEPKNYLTDIQKIKGQLAAFPHYRDIPLILSEWGIESENSEVNNTPQAAAFSVFALSYFSQDLSLAFSFEVKDGPPPSGGKWGLITHQSASPSLRPKPRYFAFSSLGKIRGEILSLRGTGTFVSGLASREGEKIAVLLVNYDREGKNTENVPVTFTGLSFPSYLLKYSYPLEEINSESQVKVKGGIFQKSFLLRPNSLILLELSPSL